MKPFFYILLAVLAWMGCAQKEADSPSAPAQTEPFLLDQALEKAKAEKRFVFLDFTGSDWCPPCIELERNFFSRAEFKQFASTNLIVGKIDFPNRIEQSDAVKQNNETLSERFKVEYFPTFVLLNADGKELWRHEKGIEGADLMSALRKHAQQ